MSSLDPLSPQPGAVPSLAGPLRRITLCTANPDACRRFYAGVLGMSEAASGSSPSRQAAQRVLWGLESQVEWGELLFRRPSVPQAPSLRILVMDRPYPQIRPGMDALIDGGLSVGFPVRDMAKLIEYADRLGFKTTNGITHLAMKRNDGSAYEALECHFRAPDAVYGLGVGRPADLAPVGPIPQDQNIGGPAYAGQVANHADKTLAFYTQVLGWMVRRDVTVSSSGPAGGLGLKAGTPMRFIQIFEPTSTTAYAIFLDFADLGRSPPVNARPPNLGATIWTFQVSDLAEAERRAKAIGHQALSEVQIVKDDDLGDCRGLAFVTANGFMVELLQSLT